ncbi:hypothetical protein, partial [Streptomyces sp. NPDC056255]|uniref:hypothetical protein n=1 Tax=Streptomyces sp. NPDC056255 TaxID=3345764 RepID=UPI0035D8E324
MQVLRKLVAYAVDAADLAAMEVHHAHGAGDSVGRPSSEARLAPGPREYMTRRREVPDESART